MDKGKMAKEKKARRSVTLDSKITAAQEKVVRAKARYEKAVKALEALMWKNARNHVAGS